MTARMKVDSARLDWIPSTRAYGGSASGTALTIIWTLLCRHDGGWLGGPGAGAQAAVRSADRDWAGATSSAGGGTRPAGPTRGLPAGARRHAPPLPGTQTAPGSAGDGEDVVHVVDAAGHPGGADHRVVLDPGTDVTGQCHRV